MGTENGFVFIERDFENSVVGSMPPVTREVWLYILRKVCCENTEKYSMGHGLFYPWLIREDLCWWQGAVRKSYSAKQVRQSIHRLTEKGLITVEKYDRGLVITVLDYEKHQMISSYENCNGGL